MFIKKNHYLYFLTILINRDRLRNNSIALTFQSLKFKT